MSTVTESTSNGVHGYKWAQDKTPTSSHARKQYKYLKSGDFKKGLLGFLQKMLLGS